jgi:hypothetical protein
MSENQKSNGKETRKRKRKERTGEAIQEKSAGKSVSNTDVNSIDPSVGDAGAKSADHGAKRKKLKSPKENGVNGDVETKNAQMKRELTENEKAPDFASYYLRKITQELADDLDKVRSANDFSEKSLPTLIHALQQGQGIFSEEEKAMIMKGS